MSQEKRTRLRSRLSSLFDSIVVRLSPNRSSRGGTGVRMVVIHTTEGSYGSAVNWFLNSGSSVSSHYVVSDVSRPGGWNDVTMMVPEEEKAWTARSANPLAVQYELAGYASRTREEWLGPYRQQIETTAALVAEDVLQYGIPIRRSYPGIVGHADLNGLGFPNNHTDPGPGFPWDVFLARVQAYVRLGDRPPVRQVEVKLRDGSCLPNIWSRVPKWAWDWARWLRGGREGKFPVSGLSDQQKQAFWLWFRCTFLGRSPHDG